jgi:LL-diaminopimelate aminotransferase
MEIFPAQRIERLPVNFFTSLGAKITGIQAAGGDVIRLDVGSPDLPPAPQIIEALAKSASAPDRHGYQPHKGSLALRTAWAEMYRRVYAVELDPETEIVPLLGSKEGVFHMMLAWVNPGDIVLIPDPGYITYTSGTTFAGGEPYYLPLRPERDFLPDLKSIPEDIASRAKVLWLNYPNNPTAAVALSGFFEEVTAFAHEYQLLVCHDAAYTQVTFDGYRAPSILSIRGAKEVAVEFNTLSKSHNMAGWRVGAAVGNSRALSALYSLKTNADSSHFLPILEAATLAMTGDQAWLIERNEAYRQRRDVALGALQEIGLHAAKPCASLYVWAPVPSGWSSLDFAAALLDEAHVSLTPGTVFGAGGEGYVRIALTAPTHRVAEAMDRITRSRIFA